MADKKETRALVLGATGLVGHYCLRRWRDRPRWRVTGTSHRLRLPGLETIDIQDAAGTAALIRDTRPNLIALSASNPFVDYCEQHPQQTRAVNVEATLAVARAAKEAGATLVFFSTDYVFDGLKAPYGEGDPVSPLNDYGRQKVDAERGIAALGPDHLLLRISGVFGWEFSRKNLALQLVDRLRKGERMRVATDLRYNPTYAANLPDVIAELFEGDRRGLYHVAGAEEVSRYDLAVAAARAFELDRSRIEPVPYVAVSSPTPRPLHTSLRTDKVRSQVKAPLWGAQKALLHMRSEEAAWQSYVDGLKLPSPSR